jgi:iron complex outermembrane receptor protein
VSAARKHPLARIRAPDLRAPATLGKEIENVPRYLVSTGLAYPATDRIKLSAWANAQGAYYVENTNTQDCFGQYALLNLGATYRLTLAAVIQLQLRNATNRNYVYNWYGSTTSGYSLGDGWAVYASLNRKY